MFIDPNESLINLHSLYEIVIKTRLNFILMSNLRGDKENDIMGVLGMCDVLTRLCFLLFINNHCQHIEIFLSLE